MQKSSYRTCVILLVCILVSAFKAHAQYDLRPKIYAALKAYTNKEYLKSAQLYSEDLIERHYYAPDDKMLYAARMWALADVPDSAFSQLNRMAKGNYSGALKNIFTDDAFDKLKSDSRWMNLTELLKSKGIKPEQAVKKNYMLIAELLIIYYDDQHYRLQLDNISQKYGMSSPEIKAKWQLINKLDSVNQQKVETIIDKYHWPKSNEIDKEGSNAIFLVIQHAKLAMKLKYLPLIKEAYKMDLVTAPDMALLEDRINTMQHKKQLYGSQLIGDGTGKYYVEPLEDPDNVDKRRAEMGLQPMNEYLKYWKMAWDVEQYKKDLPKIEELENGVIY
ncbi:DUF6624 domain-containing protein [Mucilaginibacter sp.]|uniref:DUF6624 domain-containing protein n=1 Tax=Mucilaginibacter sp. TaxID=1882438 RepID=UPI002604103E|nr:DUF6624 domain-containing protein [Mucilaginibacter sp.]MDB5029801.1 hypothetical protein [Mucilaginibacter sp.]